jgi:hypothetical protein
MLASNLAYTADLFRDTLPRKPYCTDDFQDGLTVRSRSIAVQRRYVQPNPPTVRVWLVFDVDREQAAMAAQDANLATPTWTAQNPTNGHAHLAYGLRFPVATGDAQARPLRLAAAVEAAYRDRLGADRSYSGLTCKNPVHPAWRTRWGPQTLYELAELADHVDLTPYATRRQKALESVGLGRNVTVFDATRRWAYAAVREYWQPNGEIPFRAAVAAYAAESNVFPVPLPIAEIRSISKSVSRWVWRTFTPAAYRAIQSRRGSRNGAAKRATGLSMLQAGATPRAVADALKVDPRTVYNWRRSREFGKSHIRISPRRGSFPLSPSPPFHGKPEVRSGAARKRPAPIKP